MLVPTFLAVKAIGDLVSKRRVVVTGMGMVSPLGLNLADSWQGIVTGRSGVKRVEHFDVSDFGSQISGSVRGFKCEPHISAKDARKMDLFIQYGLVAAIEAVTDSGLETDKIDSEQVGVAIGSGIGGLPYIEKNHGIYSTQGARKISPFIIPAAIINMISGHLSIRYNFKGPNIAIVTACTSGTHNIGYAARAIQYGEADVMVAGGSEMATCPLGLGGFSSMRALSTRNDAPEKASRPWDKGRDGFVLGDGAGVLVLEEYEYAKQRGANIYAELVGFGVSSDGYHMTAPDPNADGFTRSIKNALRDAAIDPTTINYVNAHGTSTPLGDPLEVQAVKQTFGEHAYKLAMSSTKSMTGHMIAAAGAVEAIFSILAIRDQVLPPTINLDEPEEGCDLDFVPHEARQATVNTVLSNSFGFGGTNGTVIFKKV